MQGDSSEILQRISVSDPYINTIIYNYFNYIQEFLESQSSAIDTKINDQLDNVNQAIIISASALLFLSLILQMLILVLMNAITDKKEYILFLFLDI